MPSRSYNLSHGCSTPVHVVLLSLKTQTQLKDQAQCAFAIAGLYLYLTHPERPLNMTGIFYFLCR